MSECAGEALIMRRPLPTAVCSAMDVYCCQRVDGRIQNLKTFMICAV